MGKKTSVTLTLLRYAVLVVFVLMWGVRLVSAAEDLPLAAKSQLSGITFDDKPISLPVQKNFRLAMTTAGNELGRTCGKMEAFGWQMPQSEQPRVDKIFNGAVEKFRGLGYSVEMQTPKSITPDITMFTADRSNKHILSMWSAGEIGLVMVLCETSSGPKGDVSEGEATQPSLPNLASASLPSTSEDSASASAESMMSHGRTKTVHAKGLKFSPVGVWKGGYTCGQGYTGGTLTIENLRGDDFDGTFSFYPTPKNRSVPMGRYRVFGQYDRASHQILINPGKWEKRPPHFYNTVIVGGFDPIAKTLSAYFQGITGCTSFEASLSKTAVNEEEMIPKKKHVKKSDRTIDPKQFDPVTVIDPSVASETAVQKTIKTKSVPVVIGDPVSLSKPDDAKTGSVVPAPSVARSQTVGTSSHNGTMELPPSGNIEVPNGGQLTAPLVISPDLPSMSSKAALPAKPLLPLDSLPTPASPPVVDGVK